MTKPTGIIDLIICAFATQEGAFASPTDIPRTRNNPLDLDYAGQLNASGTAGEVATFTSYQAGITAGFRQIWEWTAMGATLRQMVGLQLGINPGWNADATVYLANVCAWTGLPADVPVMQLIPALVALN
jgi:hypothetical protein